jgi:hypothetical protein
MNNLQIDLNRLGEFAFENEMIINPTKSKAVCFTIARVKEPLNYSLRDIVSEQLQILRNNFTQRFKLGEPS